jgi:hypothetical protein
MVVRGGSFYNFPEMNNELLSDWSADRYMIYGPSISFVKIMIVPDTFVRLIKYLLQTTREPH